MQQRAAVDALELDEPEVRQHEVGFAPGVARGCLRACAVSGTGAGAAAPAAASPRTGRAAGPPRARAACAPAREQNVSNICLLR